MKLPILISKTTVLLVASLLANVALIIVCASLLTMAKSFYSDYRYFRALEIGTSEATELAAVDPQTDETRIVLYGDSRIQNWIPFPSMDNTVFINAGINGETTTEMRRRFEQDVLRHNPDIVIIQAGTNDLTASVTRGIQDPQKLVNDMHRNMQYFVDTLTDQNIQVILTSVFPNNTVNMAKRLFWFDTLLADIEANNKVFEKLTENPAAHWLDLSTVFYSADNHVNSNLYIDTLHVNPAGYQQINQLLGDLLATLVE